MENQYQKWVQFSYVAVAALLAYIVFAASTQLIAIYDLEARWYRDIDLVARGVSILIGAVTFWILFRHERVNQFMTEVVTELARVTWPTQKETVQSTGIVIVMVLISGVFIGLIDYIWAAVIRWIL